MGMRHQASGGWGARRRRVHRRAHHPRDREGLRRLRGRRHRQGRQPQVAGPGIREKEMAENGTRRIRLGMVGGGTGAFIGYVHRIASRLDGDYELVAGALSSRPSVARESGRNLGLDPKRIYASYEEMAAKEAAREDGIEAVSIVTPNHMHFGPAKAFLEAGIHVICDKPLTSTLEDARALREIKPAKGAKFLLTHNYTGYPLVRQARQMVRDGVLGKIRGVQAEYPQDWLTTEVHNKQADWRTDPKRSGAGGAIGDIGTHAYNLARFVTGLRTQAVCAD